MWRESALQYSIQKLQLVDSVEIIPVEMEATGPIREVTIPLSNNVTSNICKSNAGGQFDLKKYGSTMAHQHVLYQPIS